MPQKEVDYVVRLDFGPFVRAFKNLNKTLTRMFRTKYVSYGRAPNIGPGTDI